MVLSCNFLSWNKYRRKSAMAFRGGALKSTWLLRHHFVKMVHFASSMDLVDPLWGASICAATASEKSCTLIAVALGAKHVGSGWLGSCVGSGWKVESPDWADWAGTLGFDWTWPLGPKNRTCLANQCNQYDSAAWVVLQLFYHFAQDGCWWEGIWVQIFLGQEECIHCPCLGVWNLWYKLWQFVIEPGGKQVHLGLVPPGPYGLEDLWVKGPFCLDGLT